MYLCVSVCIIKKGDGLKGTIYNYVCAWAPRNSVTNVTLEILQVAGLEEASLGFALADCDRFQVDGDVRDEHLVRDLGPWQP